jgi:ATP-dependent RNA helicase DDX52/ROK1
MEEASARLLRGTRGRGGRSSERASGSARARNAKATRAFGVGNSASAAAASAGAAFFGSPTAAAAGGKSSGGEQRSKTARPRSPSPRGRRGSGPAQKRSRREDGDAVSRRARDGEVEDAGSSSDDDDASSSLSSDTGDDKESDSGSEGDGSDETSDDEPKVSLDQKSREMRNRLGIKVRGTDVPNLLRSLRDLRDKLVGTGSTEDAADWFLESLRGGGYEEPTPIQRQVWPSMLDDREVFAIAPTGSGKTLSFALPILAKLREPDATCGFRAVVVSPTRELALQTHREFKRLLDGGPPFRLCVLTKNSGKGIAADATRQTGKKGQKGNKGQKGKGSPPVAPYDILITTPQRLVAMVAAGTVSLAAVAQLVFDEADKLFGEEQFLDQVSGVVSACTDLRRRVSFFSATMLPAAEKLARSTQSSIDPLRIVVGDRNAAVDTVAQSLVFCGGEGGKLLEIKSMAARGELTPPALIFCQSKDRAQQLFREMTYANIQNVDVIHAGRTAAQRQAAVDGFRSGDVWVLVATDVMARGLDFKGVQLVINYDFPQTTREYVHRVGRTGRAGKSGRAVTLFTERDAPYLRAVANVMKRSGSEVADWVMSVKPASKSQRRKIETRPIRRAPISRRQVVDDTSGRRRVRIPGRKPQGEEDAEG